MEQRYRKYPVPFDAMLVLLCYFRSEINRQQFLSRFMICGVPQKLLPSDRRMHLQIKEICVAYQCAQISDTDFDEQLMRSFRNRPQDRVFSPPYAEWDENLRLMSRLAKKMNALPLHFDGAAWNGYLSGRVKRTEYANAVLAWRLAEQLENPLYIADKTEFKKDYAAEISVCMRLHMLCEAYKKEQFSDDSFDLQFLQLAKEFCSDISE